MKADASPEVNEIDQAEKDLASYQASNPMDQPMVKPVNIKLETDDLEKIINAEMAKVDNTKIKNNQEIDL
jgi:hypothetical protein